MDFFFKSLGLFGTLQENLVQRFQNWLWGPELTYLQDSGWSRGAVEVPLGTAEEDSSVVSVSLVLPWKRKAAGLSFRGGCLPPHLPGPHSLERGGRDARGICSVRNPNEPKSPHSLISGVLKGLSASFTSNQGVPVTQQTQEKKKQNLISIWTPWIPVSRKCLEIATHSPSVWLNKILTFSKHNIIIPSIILSSPVWDCFYSS